MSEPLRIAMAGLGRMGRVHARNLLDIAKQGFCEVVALVDADRERLTSFSSGTRMRSATLHLRRGIGRCESLPVDLYRNTDGEAP